MSAQVERSGTSVKFAQATVDQKMVKCASTSAIEARLSCDDFFRSPRKVSQVQRHDIGVQGSQTAPIEQAAVQVDAQKVESSGDTVVGSDESPAPFVDKLVDWYKNNGANDLKQAEVAVMSRTQMDALRDEFSCMFSRLTQDFVTLEARLTLQMEAAQTSTNEQVAALEARLSEKMQALEQKSSRISREGLRLFESSCNAEFVNDISEHVIARVNSDPRICRVVESLESLSEHSSTLLSMLKIESSSSRPREQDGSLHQAMLETSRTFAEQIALETHQRNHQDCSGIATECSGLEKKYPIHVPSTRKKDLQEEAKHAISKALLHLQEPKDGREAVLSSR